MQTADAAAEPGPYYDAMANSNGRTDSCIRIVMYCLILFLP